MEDYDYEEEKEERERARGMIEHLDVSQSTQKPLPIMEHEQAILAALDDHDLVLIEGDTGCGKSTQVRACQGPIMAVEVIAGGGSVAVCTAPVIL